MSEETYTDIKFLVKTYRVEKFKYILTCKDCKVSVDYIGDLYDTYPSYACPNCKVRGTMNRRYPREEELLTEI